MAELKLHFFMRDLLVSLLQRTVVQRKSFFNIPHGKKNNACSCSACTRMFRTKTSVDELHHDDINNEQKDASTRPPLAIPEPLFLSRIPRPAPSSSIIT